MFWAATQCQTALSAGERAMKRGKASPGSFQSTGEGKRETKMLSEIQPKEQIKIILRVYNREVWPAWRVREGLLSEVAFGWRAQDKNKSVTFREATGLISNMSANDSHPRLYDPPPPSPAL